MKKEHKKPIQEWLTILLNYLDGRGLVVTDDDLIKEAISTIKGYVVLNPTH